MQSLISNKAPDNGKLNALRTAALTDFHQIGPLVRSMNHQSTSPRLQLTSSYGQARV